MLITGGGGGADATNNGMFSPSAGAAAPGGELSGPSISLKSALDGPSIGADPGDISRSLSIGSAATPAASAASAAPTAAAAGDAAGKGSCRCKRRDGAVDQLPPSPGNDECDDKAAAPAQPAAHPQTPATTPPATGAPPAANPPPGWTVGTAQVKTLQLGPVLFSSTEIGGKTYGGAGVSLFPGFGATREACVVLAAPGSTPTDVVTGPSIGASLAAPTIGPTGSVSANTSGVMACEGISIGTGGRGASLTFVGEGAQSNADYLARQNALDLARAKEGAQQFRNSMVPKPGS